MKFGAVPLKDALGAVLAHSANLTGGKLRKGKMLDADDIKRMVADGWQDVIVARLDADDLDEDIAATALGAALVDGAGHGLRLTTAATGRVNVHATTAGLVRFDPQTIIAVNSVNPMITVAIVPDLHRVAAGDMVATIKIISYGVPKTDLHQSADIGRGAVRLATPALKTATLIETAIGADMSPKGRNALKERLDRFDVTLTDRVIVPHVEHDLARAIGHAAGDVVLILTASATSDEHDVAPAALRHAGGTVTRFGMPVDPGNLLFLGALGDRAVIGLPGCARSPALNGADWVLERIVCGIAVTSQDIAQMGVGGLLKEIPTRPRPRDIPVA